MRLLISFVNSDISLACYDVRRDAILWELPNSFVAACGICYIDSTLWVAAANDVYQFSKDVPRHWQLGATFPMQLHSIHPLPDGHIGVVDTGNSALRVFDDNGSPVTAYFPVGAWENSDSDTIHLNDFVHTPYGILGSCFDHRPYKEVRKNTPWEQWCRQRSGVIINLSGNDTTGRGSIVGCGFNHPHSLTYLAPYLYVCSSATGVFKRMKFDEDGVLYCDRKYKVTDKHFLRGALKVANKWILGGSARRHWEPLNNDAAIYILDEDTGEVHQRKIKGKREIYDILLWDDAICDFGFPGVDRLRQ